MERIKRSLIIGTVITAIFVIVGLLSSCESRSDHPIASVRIQEVKPEITKYRLNHNKLLYDVILNDGSRCVVSTGGGLYCEFIK